MNKKYFVLAGILVVLVIAYIISEMSFKSSQTTFDPDILKIDSAEIADITFISSTGDSMNMSLENGTWKLRKESLITTASSQSVGQLLSELGKFRINRLASNDSKNLADYNLSDSLKSQIIIKNSDKKTIAHLYIGKVSFQPRTGQGMYGGQQSVDGITYFQISGDEKVYAAMSFLGMMVTLPSDNWRDHTILQCDANSIIKVSIKSPEGGFVLSKENNKWNVDGNNADTIAVQQFIGGMGFQGLGLFGNSDIIKGNELYSVQVETENQPPVKVSGYALNDSTIIIRSTINPETFIAYMNDPFVQNFFLKKGETLLEKK